LRKQASRKGHSDTQKKESNAKAKARMKTLREGYSDDQRDTNRVHDKGRKKTERKGYSDDQREESRVHDKARKKAERKGYSEDEKEKNNAHDRVRMERTRKGHSEEQKEKSRAQAKAGMQACRENKRAEKTACCVRCIKSGRVTGDYVLQTTWNHHSVCRPLPAHVAQFERCASQAQAAFWLDISHAKIAHCYHDPYIHHKETNTMCDIGNDIPCYYIQMRRKFEFWDGLSQKDKVDKKMQIWACEEKVTVSHTTSIHELEKSLCNLKDDLYQNQLWFISCGLDARIKLVSENGVSKIGNARRMGKNNSNKK
jgi:uncharacterized protein YhaN